MAMPIIGPVPSPEPLVDLLDVEDASEGLEPELAGVVVEDEERVFVAEEALPLEMSVRLVPFVLVGGVVSEEGGVVVEGELETDVGAEPPPPTWAVCSSLVGYGGCGEENPYTCC
jgi:hypothetical protein